MVPEFFYREAVPPPEVLQPPAALQPAPAVPVVPPLTDQPNAPT
jgi:hypothetical protein